MRRRGRSSYRQSLNLSTVCVAVLQPCRIEGLQDCTHSTYQDCKPKGEQAAKEKKITNFQSYPPQISYERTNR